MKTANYIDDGYTRKAYLKPEPGIHEGMLFEYRPMLPEPAEDLEIASTKVQGAQFIRMMAVALSKQLVSWSETDSKTGLVRPIEIESLVRIPRELLSLMRQVVQGRWAGDPVPDATTSENSEYYNALLAHSLGKNPGQEQLESDRKN